MIDEDHPVTARIARFGLPLVILIFYVTASLSFEYTPDSTYSTLQQVKMMVGPASIDARSNSSSPLWILLITAGTFLRIDALVAAKVFSLFFCSFVILFSYLLAHEVLRDRLLSFCVSLVVAMQWWLLQAAPSGSALGFGLLLMLVSLFFLLRNEYLLSALFIGLTTLLFWQAVALIALVILDVGLNSVERRHATKMMGGVVLVFTVVVLPWVLYAVTHGLSAVPVLAPFGEFPDVSPVSMTLLFLMGGLTVTAIIVIARSAEEGTMVLRTQVAPLIWICVSLYAGLVVGIEFLFVAIPLLIIYGFLGLREVLVWLRWDRQVYTVALVVTGLMIIQNQIAFQPVRSITRASIIENSELVSIGIWLKANASEEATVSTDRPGIIGYYSDLAVTSSEQKHQAAYVVEKNGAPEGYQMVFEPTKETFEDVLHGSSQYKVWGRK